MLLPNEPPPEEGIRHRQSDIQVFINQTEMGTGTLYIAESRVSWAKDGADNNGNLSFEYPRIAVHAVSTERTFFPHPCLYLMIEGFTGLPEVSTTNGSEGGASDSDNDSDVEAPITEVRFVPRDLTSLELMYKALNDCQALHPDPEDQDDEDEGWLLADDDDDDEGEYELSQNGHHHPGTYNDIEIDDGEELRVGPRALPHPHNLTMGRSSQEEEEDEQEAMETGQFDDADM